MNQLKLLITTIHEIICEYVYRWIQGVKSVFIEITIGNHVAITMECIAVVFSDIDFYGFIVVIEFIAVSKILRRIRG